MLKTFIERPVLSTVISVIIVVLGIIGLNILPVEQYPDIAPPTVRVVAQYPGANAEVILNSVVIPLEEQINGVEGMTYMTSSAMNGMAQIQVFFKQGIDPDIASVNVQNRAARANPLLPAEVVQTGVIVQKQQNSTLMGVSLSTSNPDYDGRFLQNFANINIVPQIKRVPGVGEAQAFGSRDYSMRVWLKPDVMASYKLTPQEIIGALQEQNIEAAPGELGQNSDQSFQYTLRYTGKLKAEEEFQNIILRSENNQVLRLKDVATVELASLNYSVESTTNGEESAFLSISQTAGSNAQQVIKDIKKVLAEAESSYPPGVKTNIVMDSSQFLDASINKVLHTLIEAFILVFIVVLVFLQNFRATLIPAIAVPVAIIGTFFFLELFGFSVNLLTLFALVLAIGIVVDDAIVVVEAVHAELERGATNTKDATIKAMKEIAPAIISITLVMASVFIPISFIGGTSGVFFKQFGLTLAVAIILSAVNALTLSPALCALFLQPQHDEEYKKKNIVQKFCYSFNVLFDRATNKYKKALHFLGKKRHRWMTVVIIAVSSLIFAGLYYVIPSEFVPNEDSGVAMGFVTLTPGASLERTSEIVTQVMEIGNSLEGIETTTNITGYNFMAGSGSSYATIIFKLKPWGDRTATTNDIVAQLNEKTKGITEATFLFTASPTLQGFGISMGVDLQLQDRTGGDINYFYEVTQNFINRMRDREEVMMAMTNFDPNFPQKEIVADIEKIKASGLALNDIMTNLQINIGSLYASNFNIYGKQFRVMVQAAPEYRTKLDDLNGLFVRTGSGEMAPITEFIEIRDITAPQALTRFNLFNSMNVIIIPNIPKGYSTGDVLKIMEEEMKNDLTVFPAGYSYEYAGMSREEANAGSETLLIFGICIIFIYLLLAALYESYILPLVVLFSLPVGLAGVFIFLALFGLQQMILNNIYVQISMIMLIGLLAKNAILIVEYALQRRRQGQSVVEAAVNGAVARLRPILMTSFAFIAGLLPLVFATGAGAVGNRSIGISAVGGMFIGTMIGVLVIPSLFIIFQLMQEKFSKSGLINSNEEAEALK